MKYLIYPLFVLFGTISYAQGLYDLNTIQTIEITFVESNWDQLLDNAYAGSGDYIMAESVTINGTVFDSVGVKYKGNSSYNANQTKNPWHIELDTYKDQEYEGYTDIKLSNGTKDPSFLREVLSYEIIRQYMDAPLSNYANVYVNGNLLGLYTNAESISKKFVNNRFGSKSNTFVKCSPPDGAGPGASDYPNLVYLGQDSLEYYDGYELKSDAGWQELIDFCDTLANHPSAIEKILDVDRALWMLAFDNVAVNLDSYIGAFSQNYYLYRDDYGRFLPIIWDLNESFGRFSMTGTSNLNSTAAKQQMSHLLHQNDASFPLVQKLLGIPMYKRMYLAHIKTILLENFNNGAYKDQGIAIQAVIDGAVQADVNKLYTYNDFLNNLTSDIGGGGGGPGGPGGGGDSTPGITNLMDGRSSYLLGLNDFTQVEPAITNVSVSTTSPLINETISITASITNENAAYLGYRSQIGAPFNRIEMFDDGAHNDGTANDGVYGVDLAISTTFVQYYIYAENSGIGKFSPQRAEHEFHTITANSSNPTVGDLVINEFMASNDETAADQDGEFDDWVELYNKGTESIDVEGYFLSDDPTDLTKWAFPTSTIIEPGGYLIVWADDDEEQSGLHCNFKLSAAAESVILVNPLDTTILDEVTYIDQTTDISFGRLPNGTGDFQVMTPTFNAENTGTTNTSDTELKDQFLKVFPNPAQDEIILAADTELVRVSIFNLAGQRILEQQLNQLESTMNIGQLTSGLYFVRAVTRDESVRIQRLVVEQ